MGGRKGGREKGGKGREKGGWGGEKGEEKGKQDEGEKTEGEVEGRKEPPVPNSLISLILFQKKMGLQVIIKRPKLPCAVCHTAPYARAVRTDGPIVIIIQYSCTNIYAYSCLKPLSIPLKAIFKQLKPCSNHGIHVLFEPGFYLKILKMVRGLFAWRYAAKPLRPGMSILSRLLLTSTLLAEMTSLTFDSASRRYFV